MQFLHCVCCRISSRLITTRICVQIAVPSPRWTNTLDACLFRDSQRGLILFIFGRPCNFVTLFTSDKRGDKCICPCLKSVCLSVSKITQKRVHGFGQNVACRQMSQHWRTDSLLSPIRIIVRMPEPDCFLRYRIILERGILRRENPTYTYWSLQRGVVLTWFYGPPLQRRLFF